ncbi:MAG TPA: hypothetical protein PK986_02690 [Spirochaetota bacterium]|nr:hypothetical protein [Spirochaetota bacterium]HQO39354.1 hypothetical protein [Spirochaetota bacterium]
MKSLLLALTVSYVITWLFGIYTARQKRFEIATARKIHLALSLVTCTLLGIYFHFTMFE